MATKGHPSKVSVPGTSASGLVSVPEDLTFKDWAECRVTIDRFDRLLQDLRKFGFSLVTGLLTANALIGRAAPSSTAIAAGFTSTMVLIGALFFLDTHYEVLLSGAVERALDIEVETKPYVRVTRTISKNAASTDAVFLILVLYLALLTAALFLGLVNTASSGFNVAWPLVVVFVLLLPGMLLYWRFAAIKCSFYKEKPRPWPEQVSPNRLSWEPSQFAGTVYRLMRLPVQPRTGNRG